MRLDPEAADGEIRFRFGGEPASASKRIPALSPEATVGIPPHLQRTVEAVLGFIYELDADTAQPKPRRGRTP